MEAESRRTRELLADLQKTISDLDREAGATRVELAAAEQEIATHERSLTALDGQISPVKDEMTALLDARSQVERSLGLYEQLERLGEIRATYSEGESLEAVKDVQRPAGTPNGMVLKDFSDSVSAVLSEWGVQEYEPIHFDQEIDDIVVAGRARPNRGKGMRSILHAAFKVALLNYCVERDLPHPGFAILDSPLVTYREPYGPPQDDEAESEAVSGYVAESFFRYLATDFPGQTIVLENVDPPADVAEKNARTIRFTKSAEGRYGFFPEKRDLPVVPRE
ncbi:hypothetical protein [Pseudonocardia hierapolitana]|uniref:hypothetical protein n=1 Tax=Pseudonocardia hierapolitana TaxID=1128676 RepID=UPI0011BF7BB5|nr:hypothetical protein [Pseudonocardia hierapolitana]